MSDNLERDIGKILTLLEGLKENLEKHVADDKEIEKRVTAIEKRNYYVAGAAAAAFFFWTMTSEFILRALGLKT